jgi:hypothetical protein
MRALILAAGAALAVAACSSNESADNTMNMDANMEADMNTMDMNAMDMNATDMNAMDANMTMNADMNATTDMNASTNNAM